MGASLALQLAQRDWAAAKDCVLAALDDMVSDRPVLPELMSVGSGDADAAMERLLKEALLEADTVIAVEYVVEGRIEALELAESVKDGGEDGLDEGSAVKITEKLEAEVDESVIDEADEPEGEGEEERGKEELPDDEKLVLGECATDADACSERERAVEPEGLTEDVEDTEHCSEKVSDWVVLWLPPAEKDGVSETLEEAIPDAEEISDALEASVPDAESVRERGEMEAESVVDTV